MPKRNLTSRGSAFCARLEEIAAIPMAQPIVLQKRAKVDKIIVDNRKAERRRR